MEPQKIRQLVSVAPEKLERMAKKMEMPLPVARDIRVQAMNILLGRCVLCGKATLAGMCGHCRKVAPQRRMVDWHSIKLLKSLNPSDQLLKQVCDRCNKPFFLSAGYLLRRLLSKDAGETKRTCNGCVEQAKEAERQAELKKLEDERRASITRQRKAVAERRKRQAAEARKEASILDLLRTKSGGLVYQPFAGNKALEQLKNELPEAPKRNKAKKGSKRARSVKFHHFNG